MIRSAAALARLGFPLAVNVTWVSDGSHRVNVPPGARETAAEPYEVRHRRSG